MSLEKLKELTGKLPNLYDIAIKNQNGSIGAVRRYECDSGYFEEDLILTENAVAVGKDYGKTGSRCKAHVHPQEIEYFIVFSGTLRVHFDETTEEAQEGGIIVIPPNTMHSAEAVTEVEFLAITIPAAEGMRPNGK